MDGWSMRFQVLGPVVAHGIHGPVGLGPARQRTVLAALLTEPGVPVSLDQLVDRVWGEQPPLRARQTLHTYLSRLRSVFGGEAGSILVRRSGSYALEVDPSKVDLHRFRELAARARQTADDDRASALWREAMALWRGKPFADLDNDWLRLVADGLERERLAALLDSTDVLLRCGEHARLLPELATAASADPLDERLAGQLMLALYRCGRQADALAHYRLLHDRLVEELGSDPGPELRELHQRILLHDPELAGSPEKPNGPAQSPGDAGVAAHRPAQLPANVVGFTGRGADLRRLDELLGDGTGDDGDSRAVVITAIGGTAGVGKTALAVHWAHRVADRFPDGQLYVNLRGYDPGQPMPAADALAGFLTALGVTGQNLPLDLDDRAARYRSALDGRRMLIMLDNAGSVAQVRPLLPGSGSCLVMVTSRDSLAGLVAVDGAHRLNLDLLPSAEAVDLLRRLVGPRVDAEPRAAAMLAEQCARLPLALRVAAELVVSRPDRSLAELVAELADRQARLALLEAGGDPYAAVREVFSWSTQHLSPEAVRAFRWLGLHPGPDLDVYAAAALIGTGTDAARRMLELLTRAHLVHRSGRGRYGMHDLLHAYATQLATTEETGRQREAAQQRLFDYYQAAAASAMDTLHPAEAHYRPEAPASATPTPDLADPDAAYAWLEDERLCLTAIVAHAAAGGRSGYVVGLARILHRYLVGGHLTDALAVNGHAYDAAERAGDVLGQAYVLHQLGTVNNRLGRFEPAAEQLQRALSRFREVGDLVGEARALNGLASTRYLMGHHKLTIDDHLMAIAVSRRAGDRFGEAVGLNNLGIVERRLGHYAAATDHTQQALEIFREIGSRHAEVVARGGLANIELCQGRHASAADHHRQALAVLQHLRNPVVEASTLDNLGLLHLHLREPERATAYFERALSLSRRTGEREAEAWALNGIGEAARLGGRPADALVRHTDALAVAAATGSRHQQARAHTGLGHAHRALGDADRARTHYEQAYGLYTELDMPDADDVREYLAELTRAHG